MRFMPVLLLAACGSSPSKPATTPTTTVTDQPAAVVEPAAATENDKSICTNRPDEFGPIVLDAAQAARRRGRDVLKYSAMKTTKEKPVEVCGVDQQAQWLMAATCEDGSRPYNSAMDVAKSRSGNVGPGGTCGTIIDLYVATCPEAQYQIHIDMYHCGPGENFM